MTTASTSNPYPSSDILCGNSTEKIRPKPLLLNLLHEAGASGEIFTLKEVMHYLGQYIMLKQLYDKQQQHIVYCGNDPLGKVFGVESFSVKVPSQLYEMLSRNLIALNFHDAAQTRTLVKETNCLPLREEHLKCLTGETSEGETVCIVPNSATSHLKRKNSESDDLDADDQPELQSKRQRSESVSDHWDAAGLPWWFIKSLQSNYGSRKSGSTDIHSNQDIDTAIVSDSTDDLWFLNEPDHDQANVEIKEGAIHPKEIRDQEEEKEEDKNTDPKEVIEVTIYEAGEGLSCSGHATDPEISDKSWKCTKCGEDNPSQKQYCLQCWALRGGWHLKCPKLTRSTSGPSIAIAENEPYEGIDVPDSKRSISEPVIQIKDLKCKEMGIISTPCASSESLDSLSQPSTSSLWRSREDLESVGKEAKTVKRKCEDSLQSRRQRLGPCLICGVRPRTGNIIHRKMGHLVACYTCAKSLYKRKMPCPVCVQPIIMVIQTFIG
uniref:MDM4, p53 regulator n=1 Tax=Callorhinchus milii TaxID=7868 RepID=A0A4W3GZU3_CALMI|eukprot:gi/632963098/ref/XP_007897692.1/ PREDICTED: protein Mdm4-like [Callorhinchus milii]